MSTELNSFKKYYKWFVWGLISVVLMTIAIWYLYEGELSFEFVVGVSFITFLSTVVYLGAMIIQLMNEIEELRNSKKSK